MRSWLVALALTATACSPALLSPVDDGESEIERLEAQVAELRRQQSASEVEVERLRRRVAELESELDSRQRDDGDAPPEPPGLQDRVGGDERLGASEIESADLPARPLPPPSGAPPPAAPEDGDPSDSAPQAPPLTPAAQELYDRGYTFYHQGRYLDAESAFQQFLAAHPESDLADNASYWIGEARFGRGDYRGALAAFRETLERYPEGNKVADALLKMGDSLARLDDPEGARESYAELIRRFPSSAAAITAEERRADLD